MHRRPAARCRQQHEPRGARRALPARPSAYGSARLGQVPLGQGRWRPRCACPQDSPAHPWPLALARGRPARREAFRTLRHYGSDSGDSPVVLAAGAGAAAGVAANARRIAQPGSPADMFQSALSSLDLFDARPPPIEDEVEQALGSMEQHASASVGRAVYEVRFPQHTQHTQTLSDPCSSFEQALGIHRAACVSIRRACHL